MGRWGDQRYTSTPPHLHTSTPPHLHTSTPPHLASDQPMGWLGGDPPDSVDGDLLHGLAIEPVAAHTIRVDINERPQVAPQLRQFVPAEQTLEDAVLHAGAVCKLQSRNGSYALLVIVVKNRPPA